MAIVYFRGVAPDVFTTIDYGQRICFTLSENKWLLSGQTRPVKTGTFLTWNDPKLKLYLCSWHGIEAKGFHIHYYQIPKGDLTAFVQNTGWFPKRIQRHTYVAVLASSKPVTIKYGEIKS